MTWRYAARRLVACVLTILVAGTLNFLVPRLTPQDPIAAMLGRLSSRGRTVEGADQLIAAYRQQFGLDLPVWEQYVNYLRRLVAGDLGYSLSYFPAKVSDVILDAIPWTLGLLLVSYTLAFVVGNLLGALAAWPRTPSIARRLVYGVMPLSAIPYYLLAIVLIYLFAVAIPIFPLGGVFTVGTERGLDVATVADLVYHSALPVASISLGLIGFWALTMRGSMTMTLGEPYLTYARARGIPERRVFTRYAVRNALLPQLTALALDLGAIVAGALLVEIIFNYPGVGLVLFNALRTADYFVIQGVVMFVVVGVALATLLIDLIYPLIDPRIVYP